jgi:hypothetical protein
MKKLLSLFLLLLVAGNYLISQDIIVRNDKTEIKAKVTEIQDDFIKYKLFEGATEPLRNIKTSDVFIIIYENGKRETFGTASTKELNSTTTTDYLNLTNTKKEIPITKGNITLGGDISFGHSNYTSKQVDPPSNNTPYESSSTSVTLSPSFGYFIFNGFVLGLSPFFSYTKEKVNLGDYSGKSYEIGVTPYVKYYFKSHFFIGLESGYSYTNTNIVYAIPEINQKTSVNLFLISPSIGYAIFINSKVSIEPSINYIYSKEIKRYTDPQFETINKEFTFSIGFHIFL